MPDIFSSAPGIVGPILTGRTLPFAIAIGGNGSVPAFPIVTMAKAVLTGFKFAGKSGLGVSHTMLDRIYVYIYGERAGEATVSGVAFAGVCDTDNTWVGFDSIYAYYERVRASTNGVPARLIFGPQTAIMGFMSDVTFGIEDPQSGVGAFDFRFVAMPRILTFGETRPLPWEPPPEPPPEEEPPP